MNRRKFIENSAASLAAVGIFSQIPNSLFAMPNYKGIKIPIGYQSYVLRDEINKDIVGTLKKTFEMGYQHVEMCSPFGYAPGTFGALAKYSGKELKNIVNDSGLDCYSAHFTWNELDKHLDQRIAFAHEMGLKHMVSSGGLDGKTMDGLKIKCDTLNKIGEKITSAGLVAGYHNHNGEFEQKKDGRPDYDIILEQLDPTYIKMQFQVAAVQLGYQAADYFRKFPGRFISAHLSDYAVDNHYKQIVLGEKGLVDWKDFFEAAKVGGLKWVYVEMESDPGTLEGSAKYLKTL